MAIGRIVSARVLLLSALVLPLLSAGCFDRVIGTVSDDSDKSKSTKSSPAANASHQLADNNPGSVNTQQGQDDTHNGNPGNPHVGDPHAGGHTVIDPQDNNPPVQQPQTRPQPRQNPKTQPSYNQPSGNRYPIQLSAGAGVPQSLPEVGTRYLFQAEYSFVTGRPDNRWVYVFAIQGKRQVFRKPLAGLKARGTLPGTVSPFRPGDGPFRGHIEQWQRSRRGVKPGTGRQVSNSVVLR